MGPRLTVKTRNRGIITGLIVALLLVILIAGCAGSKAQGKNAGNESVLRVPRLIGLDVKKAQDVAQKAGLKVEIDSWEHDKTQQCHCVVTQIPAPYTVVNPGDTISVVVNEITHDCTVTASKPCAPMLKQDLKPLPTPVIRPQPVKPLAGKIVVIDPGHQRKVDLTKEPIGPGSSQLKVKNPGGTAGFKSRTPEYVIVLQIAEKLRAKLELSGIKVVLTRESNDADLGNVRRAEIANEARADLFVRIHSDGSTDRDKRGISTLYPERNEWTGSIYAESLTAAEIIQQSLVSATGASNLGTVPRGDLTGFNWSKVPSVLIETGFLSNPEEDALLNSASYQERLAAGMASGIDAYLRGAGR